ncbi:hypothetical protein B0A55_10255 [Friedmanniomyces simplex]|uniref:Cytochrome b2, mitochondrial n=1 Tax=Friedmanniomyces simplex TaxID=329884 RepID=A0A4U0WSN8_9PEZI|nr:hypothetical protein B0A55_10255 [Friedmanniomyces simplex]
MTQKVSVADITKHATAEDCWILVNGKVYDLTRFAPEHPGGPDMIYKYAGKDGTKTYNTYHSADLIEKSLLDSEKKGDFDESTTTPTWLAAQREPTTSETNPNDKPPLSTIINLDDFEQAFAQAGAPKAQAYISGASNDLLTLNANKSFWQKLWFRPRIMRNVSTISTRTKMLGCEVAMPVWICPMGIAKTAGPEGEKALGAGAVSSGIVHCMSTAASMSIEDILSSAPKTYPFFFQLYVDRQRHKTEAVLAQISQLDQIKALFITADLAVVSKREADERLRTQEITSVYSSQEKSRIDRKGAGLARTTGGFIDPALNWEDITWVREHTNLPIVIKGVQSAADARKAMEMGCQGIVVSNHGGRALDGAPATLLVLLEIRRDNPEAFERMEVHVDGGVRRGSDVLKAVCVGAHGVGVGRPFQCAVLYDTEGVETAAAILQDELETAMRLCGVTNLEQARGDMSFLNTSELEQYLPKPEGSSWFAGLRARL